MFKEKKDVEQQDLKDKITVARQVYIKASDLVEFGLTRGCPKCDHEISYGPGRTSKPHSQTCKARIMGELVKTATGRARIEAATERLDRTVAEMGEQHRTDVPQGENMEVRDVVQHQTPQLSRLQWNLCLLILNADVLMTTCPGRSPLLLMRQEEPKHVKTRALYGTQAWIKIEQRRMRLIRAWTSTWSMLPVLSSESC